MFGHLWLKQVSVSFRCGWLGVFKTNFSKQWQWDCLLWLRVPHLLGVEATNGTELFVADTPEAFAACVVRLLRDDKLRMQTALAARSIMEKNYRWDIQLARLDKVLDFVTTA